MNPNLKSTLHTSISVLALALSIFATLAFTTLEESASEQQCLKQQVESFDIPKNVDFAGEKIPLTRFDLRERFDREITAIVYQHSFTSLSIKRSNQYFPVIEPILKRNGIPDDFKYLALIESNFNLIAVSPVKAAGIWQLMPATAKELGLEITDEIDERYDVEKSTQAACVYLKRAYAKFGDWVIVAASYNAGMGRLSEEMEQQGTDKFYNLWLNNETSRYVFRILAMKAFLQNPKAYGYNIKKNQFYPTVRMDEVLVDSTISDLSAFAKQHGVPYVLLKQYNIWLRSRSFQNKNRKTYKILIPKTEDFEFDEKKIIMHHKNWAVE